MNYYLTALSAVAGICLAFGILFLFIGLRRRDERGPALLLSLFALSYAAAVLTGIGNYSASSLSEWMASARWDGILVVLTWCFLIWYVAAYTGVRPRLFLWLLTAVFASTGIAHISRPTLIHETIFELAYVTLPWGERLAYVEATDSIWATVFLVANLVTIGYVLVACTLQFRRGERRPALVLGAGMAWFIVTIIVDLLVDLGIAPIYLGDFGFLGLAIVLGLQLSNDIMRTEEELARYRQNLEAVVEERTGELQHTNQQLAREVSDRLQIEDELKRVAYERGERVKELDCLFGISDLAARRDISLEEILQGTAELIPPAWQDPDATVVRIVLEDREFKTEYFQESPLRLAHDLVVGGQRAGMVEVRLLEERAPQSGVPFAPEEQRLLSVIAERLGRIVERLRAEEALRRRVGELFALNRIAHTVATATDLPVALQEVSEMVTDLFAARYTHVIWSEGEGGETSLQVGYEPGSGQTGPAPLDLRLDELPLVSRVLSEAKSQIIPDVRSLTLAAPVREFLDQGDVLCVMLIPLVIRGAPIGVLSVASDLPGRLFSSDEVLLAETIATDLAAAIEGARLLEHAQTAAVAEERGRLARELHDSVTQILFSINLIALSLGRLWKRNPDMAARSTDELQRLTRGALAEMRTLLRELRPQTIAATELGTLLKQLSDGVSARHDIPVDVEVGPLCEIPPEVHVALYRSAQEALSNITKHAEASQVAIRLACDDTSVQLAITDDGQGFDPDDVPAEHMGLAIMRERANAIGAEILIESQPSAGTSIAVTWPIPQPGEDSHAKS